MIPLIHNRSSRTPKGIKSAQGKFIRLKQRLQIKVRAPNEPIAPELEDDIQDGDPLPTEAPARQQSDAPDIHLDDMPQDPQVGQEPRNKNGLFNRSSPMKIFRVCKGFTGDQCKVIMDADLGDVLQCKVLLAITILTTSEETANSVKPNGWISNSTCELALYVLSKQLVNQKKCVVPLSIGVKLRSPSCFIDQSVQKTFNFSVKNRLDHKELLMFPVLQNLTPNTNVFTGHYYLIVLNLKAERFEVMDSLRSVGTPCLAADCTAIIGNIKQLWATNYRQSNINISSYTTQYIATPMQKSSYDCGFFMLKFIEEWDGRRMAQPFSQADMPFLRKFMLKKWLEWEENMIAWSDVLFKNK